jgi:hypothetical protein
MAARFLTHALPPPRQTPEQADRWQALAPKEHRFAAPVDYGY